MLKCLRHHIYVLPIALVLLLPTTAYSESKQPQHTLEIATDSLVWLLEGYSGIVSYQPASLPSFRFHAEIFGITYPESFIDLNPANAQEGWARVVQKAGMLAMDHHPFESMPSLYWGLGFNVQDSHISREGFSDTTQFTTFELLLFTGIRWQPIDSLGLFIAPYLALGIPFEATEPGFIGGDAFQEPPVQWVGSVRIGWAFPLTL